MVAAGTVGPAPNTGALELLGLQSAAKMKRHLVGWLASWLFGWVSGRWVGHWSQNRAFGGPNKGEDTHTDDSTGRLILSRRTQSIADDTLTTCGWWGVRNSAEIRYRVTLITKILWVIERGLVSGEGDWWNEGRERRGYQVWHAACEHTATIYVLWLMKTNETKAFLSLLTTPNNS